MSTYGWVGSLVTCGDEWQNALVWRGTLLAASLVSASGCSLDVGGTGAADPFTDAIVGEVPDATIDSEPPWPTEDTQPADTNGVDGLAPADASDVADDAADADAVPPLLALSAVPAVTAMPTIDLTLEGTINWAHWGFTGATSFEHKKGTGTIPSWGTTPAAAIQWDKYPVTFAWSDGEPTLGATSQKGLFQTASGSTFTFDVDATTLARKLRVYVTTDQATVWFSAKLSDASAPDQIVALPATGTAPGAGHRLQIMTVDFRAASASKRLTIKMEKTNVAGSMNLLAATLQ